MTHEIYSYSLQQLDGLESKLTLDQFNSEIAWDLGNLSRSLAQEKYPRSSVIIDITLIDGHTLFHTAINSNTSIDNDHWVKRKYNTVFRFSKSSFYMGQKLRIKEKSLEEANFVSSVEYATHGGSIPIRIKNFDGIIGALTISGLVQEEDHLLAIECLKLFKEQSLDYNAH